MLTRQSCLGAGRDRAAADEFGALSGEAVEGGVGSAGDGIGLQLHPQSAGQSAFHGRRHAGARLEPGQGQLLDLARGQQLVQSGVAERVAPPFRKVQRAVGVEPGFQRAPVLPAIAACRRSAFITMSRDRNSLPILMIGCSLRRGLVDGCPGGGHHRCHRDGGRLASRCGRLGSLPGSRGGSVPGGGGRDGARERRAGVAGRGPRPPRFGPGAIHAPGWVHLDSRQPGDQRSPSPAGRTTTR
jgi:hypothetical protein